MLAFLLFCIEHTESNASAHQGSGGSTGDEAATDEARKALVPIRRKLQGFQSSADPTNLLTYATTTENQVQNLIQEATSSENLVSGRARLQPQFVVQVSFFEASR